MARVVIFEGTVEEVARLMALHNGASLPENTVPQGAQLSDRELQVGRLLLEGRTRKEIARDLSLSAHTIKVYITGVYRKLDIHDMHGLRGKRELFEQP